MENCMSRMVKRVARFVCVTRIQTAAAYTRAQQTNDRESRRANRRCFFSGCKKNSPDTINCSETVRFTTS